MTDNLTAYWNKKKKHKEGHHKVKGECPDGLLKHHTEKKIIKKETIIRTHSTKEPVDINWVIDQLEKLNISLDDRPKMESIRTKVLSTMIYAINTKQKVPKTSDESEEEWNMEEFLLHAETPNKPNTSKEKEAIHQTT